MNRLLRTLITTFLILIIFSSGAFGIPIGIKRDRVYERLPLKIEIPKEIAPERCQEALKKEPENPDLIACVANQDMIKGRWPAALKHWKRAIQFSNDDPKAPYFLGLTYTYLKMGKASQALKTIKEGLRVKPKSIALHYWLAALWEEQKQTEKAKKEYETIISFSPRDKRPRERFYRAYAILAAGRNKDLPAAEKDLKVFLQAVPDHYLGMTLLGQIYIKMKRPRMALEILEKTEAINPNPVFLHLMLTQANLMAGKVENAIVHGNKILETEPDNITANYLVGTAYLKKGETEKGIDYLNRASDDTAGFEPAQLLLGAAYFSEGKVEEAREVLEELAEQNPQDRAVQVSLIKLLIQTGKSEAAVRQCDTILKTTPKNPLIRYMKASALLAGKKTGAAERLLERITRDEGRFYPARIQLIRLYAAQQKFDQAFQAVDNLIQIKPEHPAGYLIKGDLAYARGERTVALEAYEKVVEINPASPLTWTKILQLHIETNDLAVAEQVADRLIQKHPRFPEAYLAKGIVYLKKKEVKKAKELFQKVLELNEEHFKAHNYLGLIESGSSGNETIRHYKRSLEINPRQPVIYNQLAGIYLRTKYNNMALATAKRWAEAYPGQSGPHELIAMIYSAEKEFDKSISQFQKAIALEPQSPAAYLRLGSLYSRLGKNEKAIALYQRALLNLPDYPIFLNNLAWHHLRIGKLDKGLALAKNAEQKAPMNWNIKDTLGQIYFEKSDYSKAIQKYKEAITIDSKNPTLHFHIGKTYMAIGDRKRALEHLKEAEKHPGEFSEKEEVRDLIGDILKD